MATLNARLSQLQSQRKTYSGYRLFGSGTRASVGSLGSMATALAKRTVETELQEKISKYNDGLISNEEMKSFLVNMRNNPSVPQQDKVDIDEKIRDFDVKIRVSSLESGYKNAPNNSTEKVSSAQSLSNYYQTVASGMVPGTPAHSNALENAGVWAEKAKVENDQMLKYNRSVKRANLFNEVYQNAPNSSNEAYQKYQALTELANQAAQDGDQLAASTFQSQATQAYSDFQATSTRENDRAEKDLEKANKQQLTDYVNTTMNDYKDGRISGEQALANIGEADTFAASLGDSSYQVHLDNIRLRIQNEVAKGVTYSEDGKTKGGAGGGAPELVYNTDTKTYSIDVPTGQTTTKSTSTKGTKTNGKTTTSTITQHGNISLYRQQYDYEQTVRKLHDDFLSKKIDAKTWTKRLAITNKLRAEELSGLQTALSELDPETVIPTSFGKDKDKMKVGEILQKAQETLDTVEKEYNVLATGRSVPTLVSSGNGKPKYEFIDVQKLGVKGQDWVYDSRGIAHKTTKEQELLTPLKNVYDEKSYKAWRKTNPGMANAQIYIDPNTGQYSIQENVRMVDIQDDRGNLIRYKLDPTNNQLMPVDESDPILKAYADEVRRQADKSIKDKTNMETLKPFSSKEDIISYIDKLRADEKKASLIEKQKEEWKKPLKYGPDVDPTRMGFGSTDESLLTSLLKNPVETGKDIIKNIIPEHPPVPPEVVLPVDRMAPINDEVIRQIAPDLAGNSRKNVYSGGGTTQISQGLPSGRQLSTPSVPDYKLATKIKLSNNYSPNDLLKKYEAPKPKADNAFTSFLKNPVQSIKNLATQIFSPPPVSKPLSASVEKKLKKK